MPASTLRYRQLIPPLAAYSAGMNAPMTTDQLRALLDHAADDPDPAETAEWREAFAVAGRQRTARRARASCSTSWRALARSRASAGSPSW